MWRSAGGTSECYGKPKMNTPVSRAFFSSGNAPVCSTCLFRTTSFHMPCCTFCISSFHIVAAGRFIVTCCYIYCCLPIYLFLGGRGGCFCFLFVLFFLIIFFLITLLSDYGSMFIPRMFEANYC